MVRLTSALVAYFALISNTISATSLPDADTNALAYLEEQPRAAPIVSPDHTLEKRKGGGGRGGGSSGGSSGSSSGGGRSSSGGSARTGGGSMVGGSTVAGSGATRSYGRGGYYGGGAAVPFSAGSKTPKGLIAGALIAPIAILAIMPGIWLYNVYPYHYNNSYRFYNRTANGTRTTTKRILLSRQDAGGANETLPVVCLCQEYAVCGCDENADQSYINDLVGNGSYAALNKTLVTVSDVNGTRTLVLNGSLPNGTTAPGGQDDAGAQLGVGKYAGYWAMGLVVLYGVFM
jgi:hypothetical protein